MLVFNKIDGDWKLNTDRTFNIVAHADRTSGNKTDATEIAANIGQGVVETLDSVAEQIESGKIPNKGRAASIVASLIGRVFRENKVDGCSYFVLPVIGGGG
jgi:hypothetical protein